jgi:hypothetical protein
MSKVIAHMTMSLDGFVADPDDGVGELFGWYGNGEVTVPSNDPRWTHHVSAASTTVVQQCLDAGLLDEIVVNLAPVLLGTGIPFFANLASAPVRLADPVVIEGTGVTHLRYRVLR